MYSGTPRLQHLLLIIRVINVTSRNRRRPTWTHRFQFACVISVCPARAWMISFTGHIQFSLCVTQYGSTRLYASTPVAQRRDLAQNWSQLWVCVWLRMCVSLSLYVFPRQVGTSRVGEEDEGPDAGGAADDQAHGQHHAVLHLRAQPAHEEEAQDDLHPTQAVHQAVAQLTEAEVALRQGSHHGLGVFREMFTGSVGWIKGFGRGGDSSQGWNRQLFKSIRGVRSEEVFCFDIKMKV